MNKGTVKWFNDSKVLDSFPVKTAEMCLCTSATFRTAASNPDRRPVQFDIVESPKGPKAANVVKL
jgi:hypothetical protein